MNYTSGQQRQGPAPERPLEAIWPSYLKGGYFDSSGNLRDEYVARERVEALAQAMVSSRRPLTANQLRRYFSHCRRIEADLAVKPERPDDAWAACAATFRKLDIAAADALSRDNIPRLFHDFIQRNCAATQSRENFLRGFLPHFEALVGFGSKHFKDERR